MRVDFEALARGIAAERGLEALEPVIEKEIVHYEMLQSLSRHGLLESLSFQGGTCLRLCYGSQRYSEDLDFAAGSAFDSLDLDGFSRALSRDLLRAYDVSVRVREPKTVRDFAGVGMRRWTVVVDTATERPDIPSQRIKLEIASVPGRTSEVREVGLNYPELPVAYGQTLVRCQSPEEIMADKLVSFAATEGYVRHRDLWDVPWLAARPRLDLSAVPGLVAAKHGDYGCPKPLPEMVALGLQRSRAQISGPAFREQMRRFLPPDVYARTAASPDYRAAMLERVENAYGAVADGLGIEDEVEAARLRLAAEAAAEGGGPQRARTVGKTI